MTKFENKITELGLQRNKLSKSIQSLVKEFDEAKEEVDSLKADLSNMEEDDEDREALLNEIQEYEALLKETDEKITKKLIDYGEKKPYYDAKFKHMMDAAAAKKAGVQPTPSPKASEFQQSQPAPQPAPEPTPQPAPEPVPVATEEKKKDSGNWFLWGALGVVGIFVGVNLFKNKQ